MVPVGREQLEALHEALQLFRAARVEPPTAYLFARFRPERLTYLKAQCLMEIEETYLLSHGMDEERAKAQADAAQVLSAGVKIPVSEDILHFVLGSGLIANKDEAVLKLSTGDAVNVMLHRGMSIKVSFEAMQDLTLANDDESLEAYLHKVASMGAVSLT